MKRWIQSKKGKSKQIEAKPCDVDGLFLNRDPRIPKVGWAITHRASGLRVGPYYFKKRATANDVAVWLTEEHDIDWSIKDPYEIVRTYFGINQWLDKLLEEELSNDEYSFHP